MIKRFLTSLLGTLAGIWISFGLLILLSIIFIVGIISSSEKQMSAQITDNSVLYLDLSGTIEDRKQEFDILAELYNNGEKTSGLNEILYSIEAASKDNRINGIYINCDGAMAGIASREEIVRAIRNFKKSGKWVYAYADNYSQGDYYVACASDSIFLNPLGSVDISGLSATTFFYKGLLDKIGVEAQIIKVGSFKSAVEPFILTEMSEPSRLQQEHYLGNIWGYISSNIAVMRNVTVDKVNLWADSLTVTETAGFCVENGIVDHLTYRHEIEERMEKLCNVSDNEELNLVSPAQYFSSENLLNPDNSENNIAVLYAIGDIVDQGDEGIVGRTLVPKILELAEDDDISGLVLRVNSGGGSAFASEQIWEALEQFKATGKPFYVSMGNVAASGGYYISCGADCIYAEPVTLTGSIGIFGIIPCIKPLLNDKLGITQGTVSTNANGGFISLSEPMTKYQRQKMQKMINVGYENFVSRCATGRSVPVDSIKAIAEGRVWDGKSAYLLGLVDKIGGLDMAVADIAEKLGFENYAIKEYPSPEEEMFEQLMNGKFNVREHLISSELGDSYKYYKQLERIQNLDMIQCRMEEIIIE